MKCPSPSVSVRGAVALAWLVVAATAGAAAPVPDGAATKAPGSVARGPAAEPVFGLDAYGSIQQFGATNGSRSSSPSFGGRLWLNVTPHLFADAEVQSNQYANQCDDGCSVYNHYAPYDYDELIQIRAGLGTQFRLPSPGPDAAPPRLWAKVQYTDFAFQNQTQFYDAGGALARRSVDSDVRGTGVHAGLRMPLASGFAVYGQGGYLWMAGDGLRYRGPEFTGGFDFGPERLKLFLEYRYSDLQGVNGHTTDVHLGDARAGLRLLL